MLHLLDYAVTMGIMETVNCLYYKISRKELVIIEVMYWVEFAAEDRRLKTSILEKFRNSIYELY